MTSCLRYDFLLKDFQYPKRVRSGPTPPNYPPGKSVRTNFGSDGGAEPPPPPPPGPPPGPPPARAKAAVASRSGPSGAEFLGGGETPSFGGSDGAPGVPDLSDEATNQVMPLD